MSPPSSAPAAQISFLDSYARQSGTGKSRPVERVTRRPKQHVSGTFDPRHP